MIKLFLGNRSGVLLLLPFLIAAYVFISLYTGYHIPSELESFGFWKLGLKETSLISAILGPLLVFVNAVLLNAIFNRNGFQEKNTYLPALLYVVFLSFFHSFYFLTGFGVATTILILAFWQLLKLDQNSDGRKAVFNASLLLGLAATFYPLLLISIPFLFGMIWILRPFVFRESALAIIGFVIPLVYVGIYRWAMEIELNNSELSSDSFEWKALDMYVVAGGMLLIAFAGLRALFNKINQSSIRLKKIFRISTMLLVMFVLITVLEATTYKKIESGSLGLIPLLFLITYGFGSKNPSPFNAFVFYILCAFSVGKFFIPFHL